MIYQVSYRKGQEKQISNRRIWLKVFIFTDTIGDKKKIGNI